MTMREGFEYSIFVPGQGIVVAELVPGALMPGGTSAVIFRPGIPSSGIAVETWPEVQSVITRTEGSCILYVDDGIAPAHVPASSGVTECFNRLEIRPYRGDASLASTLVIDDGATLRGVARLSGTIFLESDCQSAVPSLDFDYLPNVVGTPFPTLNISDRASFGSTLTATQPACVIPIGGSLVLLFEGNGGVFQPPGVPFFRVIDATSQVIITTYGGEFRDNTAINLVPNTWIDGAGAVAFDYDSPTVFNSIGLPQFSSAVAHFHNLDTSEVAMVFFADASDVLATLQTTGRLPKVGQLLVTVEGYGGAGGGGGGQGGNGAATGDGGGAGGAAVWCMSSGLFNLANKLDVIVGVAGTPGAAGAPGGGAGGDGGSGSQSAVRDGTTAAFICDYRGGSGGAGGGRAVQPRQGGASCGESQFIPTTAGFNAAGGSGGLPSQAGFDGNVATVNKSTAGPSLAGLGGATAAGQGGGGGGGGAGPEGNGGAGGIGSAGAGGPGANGGFGAGGGGGAGGTGPADPGGPGGPGGGGSVRISFLGQ